MGQKRMVQDILALASRLEMVSNVKKEEIWNRIEHEYLNEDKKLQRSRNRFFGFLRTGRLVVGILSLVLIITTVLVVPRVIQTTAYGKVTPNSIPEITKESFQGTGLQISPLGHQAGGRFLSEYSVLKVTNPAFKFYKGQSRAIGLTLVSRKLGGAFVHLTRVQTAGDPHFQAVRNIWENIPCYIVTIKGAAAQIPVLGTPGGSDVSPVNGVVVEVVDATSGKILMEYQYAQ